MPTGIVTATALNLRASPDGQVIARLPKGAQVEILDDQGDWLQVSAAGQTGFVSAAYVSIQTDGSAQPPGSFHFVGNRAVAPDGTVFATRYKLGVYNSGRTSIAQFVGANSQAFADTAPSRLRVMSAVSRNEGNLEAINTWDNSFLTFGVFQWTAGAGAAAGELPSLIDRLKNSDQSAFQKYFGDYGLDTSPISSAAGVTPTGFFTLDGQTLTTPAQKAQLRALEWAYRFWLSGGDPAVQRVEIEHAMSRIDLFYSDSKHTIAGRFISDYVSSEYGVALILDEHVNRPGNVPGTLAKAVNQMGSGDPQSWTDVDEARLLTLYLQARARTSMTDSNTRADRIRQSVAQGLASDKRGSFEG
jgi:hypothetical protein